MLYVEFDLLLIEDCYFSRVRNAHLLRKLANMPEAKTELSRLVRILEIQQEDVIYLARNGMPVAQMTLLPKKPERKRIGVAYRQKSCLNIVDNPDIGSC